MRYARVETLAVERDARLRLDDETNHRAAGEPPGEEQQQHRDGQHRPANVEARRLGLGRRLGRRVLGGRGAVVVVAAASGAASSSRALRSDASVPGSNSE